jgi:iron complex outermembrane recepter protein
MRVSVVVAMSWLAMVGITVAADVRASIRTMTNIPPEDLALALKTLARQRGFQVVFQSEVVGSAHTHGATGDLTVSEALESVLAGTGLTFQYLDDNTVTIVTRAAATGALEMREKPGSRLQLAQGGATGGAAEAPAAPPGGPSAAQPTGIQLEEVVVTAAKRTQDLNDLPLAVQAVTSEQLFKLGAHSFDEYAGTIAGLQAVDTGPGREQIFMRGIAAPQGYIGMESAVGVYLDDVPISEGSSQPDLNLYDIDRVEVLRGPQGTLYGSASLGGTIRIITNRPKMNVTEGLLDTELSGTEGGGFNRSFDATFNLPLVTDLAALRVVLYSRDLSGFIDDPHLGRNNVNDADTYGGRIALRVLPTDGLTLDFNVLYQHLDQGGYDQADNVGGSYTQLNQYRNVAEPFIDRSAIYNGTLQYQNSVVSVTSSTSYSDRSRDVNDDDTGFELFGNGAVTPSLQIYDSKSFTEEVRAASVVTKPVSWLFGFYYNRTRTDFFQTIDVAGAGALLGLPSDNIAVLTQDTITNQGALFGEVGYSPLDRLTFTAGFREADIRLSSASLRTGFLFGTGLQGSDSTTQRDFLPKFNISYKIGDDSLVYATASKGFRIGGVNVTIQPTADGFVFPTAYKPDSLWNYELGLKGAFLDRRLTLDADVFYIKWRNIQLDLQHEGYDYFANAGDALSRGVEIQATAQLTQAIRAGAQLTYTNATLASTTPGVGNDGDRVPYVPKLSASAFLEYGWNVSFGGGGHAYLRFDVQDVGTAHTGFGNENDYTYGDYTLTNGRLGLDRGPWRFALFARNMFDDRAKLLAQPYNAGVLSSPVVDSVTVARPRTIGLQVSRSF